MEILFEFYPYRNNWYVLIFAVITMMAFLLILFLYFNLLFLLFALINTWLIMFSYASLHTKILFCQDCFCVHDNKRKKTRDFTWEQVKYGYHTKNFKGHRFLLLSPNKLTEKQLRQYTNKSANTDRICIDAIVVLPIENSQYTSELEHFILSKITVLD